MKSSILGLALVLSLDAGLYWGLSRLSAEKKDLAGRREELEARVEALRETGVREERIEALLRAASTSMGKVERELDIAELRDLLIGAERALDLDRLSLDFRPAQEAAKGREGGRVSASLGGSFDAVHEYLARVESLRLPLAPETFSLTAEESGRVLLAIEWNGLWSLPGGDLEELSPADVAQLETWLATAGDPRPVKDLFSEGEASSPPPPGPKISGLARVSTSESSGASEPSLPPPPRLTGFVIARPELEKDVGRRVLAALRFEGELRLVAVGDTVGSYRVEEIAARESVVLVHQETGERLKLFLE
jgi:hypothetical protein